MADAAGGGEDDEAAAQRAPTPPTPPGLPPVAREGTCVQVPYQSFIDLPATEFSRLVTQALVPQAEQRDVQVLLACLDSVYTAE